MKILKIIGGIIGVILLAVVVLGLVGPKHIHVERSAQIDAPADFVFSHANTFAGMETWSPWSELDPNQVTSIEGEDGAVGAVYSWEGNEKVGKGNQTIKELGENKMVTALHFIEPFEGMADAKLTVENNENGSLATWAYDEDPNFIARVMYNFVDMEAMLGPDFQKGVDKLKAVVETAKSEKKEFGGFIIQEVDLEPRTYIGMRQMVKWADMQDHFGTSYPKIFGGIGKAKLAITGPASAVYYIWDVENEQADMMAAVPVAEGTIEGMNSETISGKALLINYYGAYEGSGAAHDAMEEYMTWHGKEFSVAALEEYVNDPSTESDQSKWHTRIMYPIK